MSQRDDPPPGSSQQNEELTPMERWQQEEAEVASVSVARSDVGPATEPPSSQERLAVPAPQGENLDSEDYDARASITSISQLRTALDVQEKRRSALEQLDQQKPGEFYQSLKEKFEPTVTAKPVKPSLKQASEMATTPQHAAPVEIEQDATRNRFVPKGYGNMAAARPASTTSSERVEGDGPVYPKYFHSRRIKKGMTSKPWLENKSSQDRWPAWIMGVSLFLGLVIIFAQVWFALGSVQEHVYCPVLMEDFSDGLSNDVWSKEVEVGGYGNGQFEQTTNTDENVFVQNGVMVIKPTLQDSDLMTKNNVINLTRSGLCTTTGWQNCITSTNTTNGTVVNPVKSARINTKKGATIKYGRIEVEAKMPKGDWLWPAIWMLPVKDTYGDWPASGEIDIVESRGNNFSYPEGGNNIVSSTLHWGPDSDNDAWWRNNNKRQALHAAWGDGWHTFGLEWSEKYLFTYVDSRLLQVIYVKFDKPFWKRGHFPPADSNGTNLIDPWSQTARDSTPFDQEFYLIMNVAVGGTNGWFEDAEAGKPWVDASPSARRDFWQARDQWYPTWKEPGHGQMEVKSVKMWQQQGYNGCK